jgi:photosystem II stability/assembly factor-like uncharacterized protein
MRCPAAIIGWCCVVLIAPLRAAPAEDEALRARPLSADAQLADVCFVDRQHGWAVGDRGTIWHTADGGQTWSLQSSGVDGRLSTVFFLDQNIGWAAGGSTQPYTHVASGVVLRTRDGGQNWILEKRLLLPPLARIGFFDPQRGWALGQASALFPSGVFTTEDGGRSWSALPAGESRGWLSGALIDPHTGALAGRTGTLAAIRRRGIDAVASDFGLRALRSMRLVPPANGFLVGDGGLVLQTADLGKSWQTTPGPLPPGVADHFDFTALAVRGPHCWVAGTPGTRVLHSPDAGRSWSAYDTGQALPIHALAFVDERTGWAAGELGTILATSDGGRTWRRQRAGGARAAFVGFYGRASQMPLELVARLSADEGYLGALELISRDDIELRPSDAADSARLAHEASVQAGASAAATAWRFPLRQAGLRLAAEQLVEGWNQANDADGLAKLEAHVVARIRMWRPSVVFTVGVDAGRDDPLSHLVSQVVLRSVEAAADPSRYPQQIAQAGLAPWNVQKVFAALRPGAQGDVTLDTAALSARHARTMGELAAPARGLIEPRYTAPPPTIGFRLLVDAIPQDVGRRDFFSGIALAPGGEARRRFEAVADSDLASLHREAQHRRNLQAMLARADADDPRDGRFLADIGEQTRAMRPDRAVELLMQLAERYAAGGRPEMAEECYALVVDRYPKHVLAGAALVWLIQYHASGEATWRNRTSDALAAQQFTAAPSAELPGQPLARRGGGVQQAAALTGPGQVTRAGGLARDLRASGTERFTKADNYARQLEQLWPGLMGEPSVRFPLAVAHRELGLPRQAERYFLGLRQNGGDDAWRACALTELWLIEPKKQPPKELWNCAPVRDKPHLDGQLDEPLWRAGNVVRLRSALADDGTWPAVAMLAYDDEYLYLGVSCTRAEGGRYVPSDAPRPRDPDLTAEDRVELLIDVDRDFVTYYRLVVDHRGWVGESCWGDRSWDPSWYVARGESEGAWTIEAAIPLAELANQPPIAGRAWAVGMQRIVPGVGFQSWTTPASVEGVPQGFGYLLFR